MQTGFVVSELIHPLLHKLVFGHWHGRWLGTCEDDERYDIVLVYRFGDGIFWEKEAFGVGSLELINKLTYRFAIFRLPHVTSASNYRLRFLCSELQSLDSVCFVVDWNMLTYCRIRQRRIANNQTVDVLKKKLHWSSRD